MNAAQVVVCLRATGTVDQELLLRNEYLAAENRILKFQLKGGLRLSDDRYRGVSGHIADIADLDLISFCGRHPAFSAKVQRKTIYRPKRSSLQVLRLLEELNETASHTAQG